MRKVLTLLTMLMLTSILAMSQTNVSGRVVSDKGDAVPNASVKVKGKNTGATADAEGNFNLNAKVGETIVVSYQKNQKEFQIKSAQMGTIVLPITGQVAEIATVTGVLGTIRQRKDIGYATAKISNDVLTQAAPINIAQGLAGKVAGLNIASINSGVFGEVKINLRGIRSISGSNSPMLIVDGAPTPIGYLNQVNPNDVADVSIIKGSSASGIYGTEARNGVIIVTTKKGPKTDKYSVIVSNTTQFEKVSFFPKFQTEFGSGGYNDYVPYENWSWGPRFDGTMRQVGKPLPDGSVQMLQYSALPSERQNFFNTGVTNQLDVSLQAKDFMLSVQDANIRGTVPDDKNRRIGIRLNASKDLGRVKVNYNTNYVQSNYNVFDDTAMSNYNNGINVGLNGGLLNLIFNTPAQIPITKYKDFKNDKFADYNGYFNDYGHNPYFALDNWRTFGRREDLISNLQFNFKVNSWINLTWRGSGSTTNSYATSTSNGETPTPYAVTNRSFKAIAGNVAESNSRGSRLTSEVFATANKNYKKWKFTTILGQTYRQSQSRSVGANVSNLVVPELFNFGNRTGELQGSNSISKARVNAFFGQQTFNYDGWANLDISGRYEKTSVLDPSLNSYFYPSVSASLVLSEAIEAIKNSNVISYFKLRASADLTYNADVVGPYSLAPTYGQASGFPYGNLAGFTANNSTVDPLIRPEKIQSNEVGFEISFFKNKINLEVAAFKQKSSDLITQVAVSSATGYTSANVNAANFENNGLEIELKTTPLVKVGDFKFNVNANAFLSKTKVTKVYQDLDRVLIGGFAAASNYAIVGEQAWSFLATDYFRDDQGRVIVDAISGYPSVDPTVKKYGQSLPKVTLGISPTITYKGLTFSVVGEYKGGHYAYHGIGNAMAWTGVSKATAANGRERFVIPNSVIADPANPGKYIPNTNVTINNATDYYTGVFRDAGANFLTSAASWRVREVALSYDVNVSKTALAKRIKAMSFSVNARNVFLFLPKSNEYTDPDFNFTTGNAAGVSTSQINPPTRLIGANVTITF